MSKPFGALVASVVLLVSAAASHAAAASPLVNGKITFDRYDVAADNAQCYTIDPDGTSEVAIGDGGCGDWSPDATKILGTLLGSAGTFNPDGSGFTPLVNLDPQVGCGFWSPDATRLLCNNDAGIYTVRSSDGGDLVKIVATPSSFADYPIGYSPDGSRVLFNRVSDDHPNALFSVNTNGMGLLQLNPPELRVSDLDFFDAVSADWSPEGSRVTFAAFSQKGSAVYVVDEDGTGLRQITPSGLGARSAQWSPDGGLIAFSTPFANPQHPQVWVVRPDGRGLREVTYPASGTSSFAPIWSPDSSKLLFQRQQRAGRAVWTVNSDGKGLTKLADIPSDSESLYEWGTAPPS